MLHFSFLPNCRIILKGSDFVLNFLVLYTKRKHLIIWGGGFTASILGVAAPVCAVGIDSVPLFALW